MKKLILAFLLLPILMFGQLDISEDFNVHTGSAYGVIDAKVKYYFPIGEEILMLKINKKKVFVQKYDIVSGRETLRKEHPGFNKIDMIESVIQLQNHIYIFFSRWDKKNKLEQLYYKEIDTETGRIGKENRIIKVNGKVTGFLQSTSSFSAKVVDKFDLFPSYDESKVVIQYRKKPETKNDKKSFDEIGMYVFNSDMEKQWSKELKMPYTEAQMNNIDYQVDKDGVGYLLAEVYDSGVSKKYIDDKRNYHLEILSFTEEGMEINNVNEKNYHYVNPLLFESAKGEMYLSGLYKEEKGRSSEIDGFFFMKIEDNSFTGDGRYYKVPLDIINQFKSERQQKKNKKKKDKDKLALENIDLRKLISTKDGGALLIAEEYFVVTHMHTNSQGHTYYTYTYHYKDLIVTKIGPSGDMVWMKKIPKAQKGKNGRGGMSFTYVERNGMHYFFYVDNLKNSSLSIDKKPAYHQDGAGGIFSVYAVDDQNGDIIKSSLANLRSIKMKGEKKPKEVYQYATNRVVQSKNGLVFEVYKKGKEDIMIHVDFE